MTKPTTASAPTPTPVPVADERLANISLTARILRRPEIGALLAAIVVGAFFWTQNALFLQLDGIANWTDVASTIGIPAVMVALLMIGGEFDLSAGVMTGTAGLTMGILATEVGMNIWLAIVLTLAMATGIGFLNGYMVMKTKLPSFIDTLATFGSHDFKVTVLWWIAITLLATWVLTRTRTGNWIFGVGGDANAARNVGVPVSQVKIGLFMTSSFVAALTCIT